MNQDSRKAKPSRAPETNPASVVSVEAYRDALTGLANRELLIDHAELALPQARRLDRRVVLLYLDVDDFKKINTSLGRGAGDRLLRAVGQRLRTLTRRGDTVARLDGDAFAVLAQGVREVDDCARILDNLRNAVKAPFVIEGKELLITAGIGVSVYPDDAADGASLIDAAKAAMHRAKQEDCDRYQIATPAIHTRAVERFELENDLQRALSLDQLVLHYQPIVNVDTGRIKGCEALLRWRHPKRGLLLPEDFLRMAELSGLIVSMGTWVLATACAQARAWQNQFEVELSLAINLSARQFSEPELARRVSEALEASGLEPRRLELEITESLAMKNDETTAKALRGLKELGVGISIDDFGTGYSSLSHLRRFPIDTLKIDRSLVREVHRAGDGSVITAAMIAMAKILGLDVIAEGVEREEQLQVVREQGCSRGQGYLFSRPLPAEEFGALLN